MTGERRDYVAALEERCAQLIRRIDRLEGAAREAIRHLEHVPPKKGESGIGDHADAAMVALIDALPDYPGDQRYAKLAKAAADVVVDLELHASWQGPGPDRRLAALRDALEERTKEDRPT